MFAIRCGLRLGGHSTAPPRTSNGLLTTSSTSSSYSSAQSQGFHSTSILCAVPKRKPSLSVRRKRWNTQTLPHRHNYYFCKCGEPTLTHHMCKCGKTDALDVRLEHRQKRMETWDEKRKITTDPETGKIKFNIIK